MATSRNRRTSRPRRPATTRPMTRAQLAPHMTRCLAADAAEARGNAERALRIMEAWPLDPNGRPFWRPSRLRRLR